MRLPKTIRDALVTLHGEDFVRELEQKSIERTAPKSIFANWQPSGLHDTSSTKPSKGRSIFADWQPDRTVTTEKRIARRSTVKVAKPRHMLSGLIKSHQAGPVQHMLADLLND